MGLHASRIKEESSNSLLTDTNNTDSNWIIAHADASDLHYPQAERLWQRFQQLGGNKNGILQKKEADKHLLTENIFEDKMFYSLMDDNETMSFQTFVSYMSWVEKETTEKKLAAIFQLLNDGKPLTQVYFENLLEQMYADDDKKDIGNNAEHLMTTFDNKQQGYVNETQFIKCIMNMSFEESSDSVLKFFIIPPTIQRKAEQQNMDGSSNRIGETGSIPTSSILQQVAEKIHRRDWYLLANKLGFTSRNIEEFEQKFPKDATKQVYDMLLTWQRKEGSHAVSIILERALRECKMNDVAAILL